MELDTECDSADRLHVMQPLRWNQLMIASYEMNDLRRLVFEHEVERTSFDNHTPPNTFGNLVCGEQADRN